MPQTMAGKVLLWGSFAGGSASRGFGPKSSFCKPQILLKVVIDWEEVETLLKACGGRRILEQLFFCCGFPGKFIQLAVPPQLLI